MSIQKNRSARINTPLGGDKLVLRRLTGVEEISRPFRFDLQLLSEDPSIDPDAILGKPLTVALTIDSSEPNRFFHGIATEFALAGHDGTWYEYRAVLRPWFWLLSHRADCRVLHNKSLPTIFAEVCGQAGTHKENFASTYQPWEYRVQYRESDFDFLSRLLEHEGVFYYFEHLEHGHVLVLTDDVAKLTGDARVAYGPEGSGEALWSWSYRKSFQADSFASREYNF
jgi:type VI secretion system secreted protein VgrG